jgi:hypothetical protein
MYSSTLAVTSGLDGGWVVVTPRPLYPRERPGTHFVEGWVGPRAGLDGCGKDTAGYKSLSYSSLFERRFVTSLPDGMENHHKDGIGVGYRGGNSRENDRQPAFASTDEDMSPVEHEI